MNADALKKVLVDQRIGKSKLSRSLYKSLKRRFNPNTLTPDEQERLKQRKLRGVKSIWRKRSGRYLLPA